jgi:hypothetical protein
MKDERWPGKDGWEKQKLKYESYDKVGNLVGKEVHFNVNKITGEVDDFKFKD